MSSSNNPKLQRNSISTNRTGWKIIHQFRLPLFSFYNFCGKAPIRNGLAGTLFTQASTQEQFFDVTIWGSWFNYFYLVHVSINHFFKMCWIRKGKRVEENWPLWFVLIEFFSIDVRNWKLWQQKKTKSKKSSKTRFFWDLPWKVMKHLSLRLFLKTSAFRKGWNFFSFFWDNFLINPGFPKTAPFLVKAAAFFPCCYITLAQLSLLLI